MSSKHRRLQGKLNTERYDRLECKHHDDRQADAMTVNVFVTSDMDSTCRVNAVIVCVLLLRENKLRETRKK